MRGPNWLIIKWNNLPFSLIGRSDELTGRWLCPTSWFPALHEPVAVHSARGKVGYKNYLNSPQLQCLPLSRIGLALIPLLICSLEFCDLLLNVWFMIGLQEFTITLPMLLAPGDAVEFYYTPEGIHNVAFLKHWLPFVHSTWIKVPFRTWFYH